MYKVWAISLLVYEVIRHYYYRYLTSEELKVRLSSAQKAKRSAERSASRLKEKLTARIERGGIDMHADDLDDLEEIFQSVDKDVAASDHFQKVFWDAQRSYRKLKNKRTVRWHPLMIRFALNLKYLSSNAYRAVGKFLSLPSERTLRDYTHIVRVDAGVSQSLIERMKKDLGFDGSSTAVRMIGVIMDEMKIKSGLVFERNMGKLVGFVDLGSVNSELEALERSMNDDSSEVPELASNMFVLMVRCIMKPSFAFPIAQYPTSSLSGAKLYPLVWDVIELLELNQFHVVFVSCDGLSANRKFFRISKGIEKELKIPYKSKNPYGSDRQIYFFCDTPHLLKTARNCFANSFAHSHSRMLKVNSD